MQPTSAKLSEIAETTLIFAIIFTKKKSKQEIPSVTDPLWGVGISKHCCNQSKLVEIAYSNVYFRLSPL